MTAPFPKKAEASSIEEAVRKDSAVHVSLSSDSLVKQPDCTTPGFAGHRFAAQVAQRAKARDIRAQKPPFDAAARTWPREHGRMLGHRVNSEGLRRRAIAPSGGAPKRSYIGFGVGFCQPFRGTERLKKQSFFAVSGDTRRTAALPVRDPDFASWFGARVLRRPATSLRLADLFAGRAALRPHSSAVLW